MKMIITQKRFVVSLMAVLCACAALSANLGSRSQAESRTTALTGSITERQPLERVEDLLPDNRVNMRFVNGPTVWSPLRSLAEHQTRPLSLATGDMNADGFPDLICSYGQGDGDGGYLVIYYGDSRAFAPSNSEDIQAALANRFATPFNRYLIIRLDHTPDFVFTGDFDRDSRRDILTASLNGVSLHFFLGGENSFSSRELALPGQLSSLTLSEAFSPDGFADIYAGIRGGEILAYEKATSVLDQKPVIHSIPGTADAITVGRFDNNLSADLAILVSGRVYIVREGSSTELVDLPFAARSLTTGDFIWDRDSRLELAVAGDDGSTHIVSRGHLDTRPLTAEELSDRRQIATEIRDGRRPASDAIAGRNTGGSWQLVEETPLRAGLVLGGSPTLIPILASGQQSADLLAFNASGREIGLSYRTDGLSPRSDKISRESVSFAGTGEPVAVLTMRLNIHSHSSLVVLDRESLEPKLLFFAPGAVATVTSPADVIDAGSCAAITFASLPGPNGVVSLREAVCAANNVAGADTVNFSAAINGSPIQLTRVGDDNTNVNGDIDVNSDITFLGNGAVNTIVQGSSNGTFTGNMGDKAFGINQSGTFTTLNSSFSDMTIRFTRNDITVNGGFTQTGGAMDIFLTGTGAMPGPTTTLTNVTFDTNASLHSYGGALNIDSGSLVAPTTGVFRGTVNITGGTFSNNDTLTTTVGPSDNPPTGGAINMFADIHNVTLANTTVTANQTSALVSANGGGINMRHSFGGTITLTNTNITNNIAGSDGGGVLTAFNQTISMSGGSISGNTSQGTADSAAGGGFFNGNNTLSTTLTGVSITNNAATAGASGTGGGVNDAANAPLSLSGCTITGNSADSGGA